nr:transposase, MuDR [Tanacetum cinerariifolium]
LDSDEKFMMMLNMYEEEKEVTFYVTTDNSIQDRVKMVQTQIVQANIVIIAVIVLMMNVKKFVKTHSCTRSNKYGNKRATQGWIANVIVDKLKSDGDMFATEIMKWLMKTYNVDVPYMRAFRGKEHAYIDMHGK